MAVNLQTAEKILLVAPHRLGDALFATPGVRVLRLAKPTAQIDVVTLSNLSFELFSHNHSINKLYRAEQFPIEKKAREYDVILPLQHIQKIVDYVKKAPNVLMLPRFTGAFHYSENFYRFILKQLPSASQFPLGPYELNFTSDDVSAVDALLKSIPKEPHPFILVLHMGCHKVAKGGERFIYKLFPFLATKDSRSWPFKRFDQLITRVLKNHPNMYVVLTGSLSERFAAETLTLHPRLLNLMGQTSVTQLAALLQRSQLLLTGDTGPLHVASAVDLPIVLLCGKTDPAATGPYPTQSHHVVIQKKGMEAISVDEVYEAIFKKIKMPEAVMI